MMDKRYQVFISSTYKDLQEERQEVIQVLLELDCIPAGMELFPAADDDQWTLIKNVINDCDYYIIIVAGRYGSLSSSSIGYTEMEYDYAISQGKPVISFIHKDPGTIPLWKTEDSDEGRKNLAAFRKKVEDKKMCKYWSSPAELGSVVIRSLNKLIKNNPAIGWVRADLVPDEKSAQEILKLKKQIEELENETKLSRITPPEGTDHLAQDNDEFTINYSYQVYDANKWVGPFKETCKVSWSKIFSTISPYLMSRATEQSIRLTLTKCVENWDSEYLAHLHHPDDAAAQIGNFLIETSDLQTIIIQLRALRLITTVPANNENIDHDIYWTLTPYGDTQMTKSRAIKKADLIAPF